MFLVNIFNIRDRSRRTAKFLSQPPGKVAEKGQDERGGGERKGEDAD